MKGTCQTMKMETQKWSLTTGRAADNIHEASQLVSQQDSKSETHADYHAATVMRR